VNTDSEDRVMIAELERIIRAEEAKPEAERDHALIDDCIKEIAEIKGVKAEFSEEEVAQITDKLIQKAEKTKKRKRFVRLVAGIAAMFVIVTGVTACAVNPALVNWFKMIVRMPFGATVEHETVSYVLQGKPEKFNSVEEMISSKGLDVYYPSILPENIELRYIEHIEENNTIILSFVFTKSEFRYTIQLNNPDFKWTQPIVSEIDTGAFHFDVYSEEGYYVACSTVEDKNYIIQSSDISSIILVAGGLRKVLK